MITRILACTVTLVWACSSQLVAKNASETLSGVPAPEIAAKAADLVKNVALDERSETTKEVVAAAVQLRPTSATAVVASIAKITPEQAATAAATAAKAQPTQVAAIVRAACASTPGQVKPIVIAVCKELPKQAKVIAVAAAQAVPGQEKEILAAVATAVPSLKLGIEKALSKLNGASFTITSILVSAERFQSTTPLITPTANATIPVVSAPPVIGPPFTPGGGSPGETGTTNTFPIGPGDGRDYSAP